MLWLAEPHIPQITSRVLAHVTKTLLINLLQQCWLTGSGFGEALLKCLPDCWLVLLECQQQQELPQLAEAECSSLILHRPATGQLLQHEADVG